FGLLPEAMLMSVDYAALGTILVGMACKATWGQFDIRCWAVSKGLSRSVVLLQQLGTGFVVCAVSRNHVKAHDPCFW
ncbi:hypothetical protein STEG23_023974, partial [Scotinomys teguina]